MHGKLPTQDNIIAFHGLCVMQYYFVGFVIFNTQCIQFKMFIIHVVLM